MTKFYSILIGENPDYTANFQPSSKRKIALYANCLLIPVILWFINVYLLVLEVLESGHLLAFISAFAAAFIIFLIERAILMSNGSKLIVGFRIVLGFLMALLGSISLDEVVFKADIDNQMTIYKQEASDNASKNIENKYQNVLEQQAALVNQKANDWNEALRDAKSEADGTGGSKQRMVGKIALLKISVANEQAAEYQKEKSQLEILRNAAELAKKEAKLKAEADFNTSAILTRIRALFDLVFKDRLMAIIYIAFTLFLFCLEFLVVIIKTSSKKSIDEELELAREMLVRLKTQKTIDRNGLFYRPENYAPVVQEVNRLLDENSISIFN
jgi:hypothetical protein